MRARQPVSALALLAAFLFAVIPRAGFAQSQDSKLDALVLDCTVHEGLGPWARSNAYPDGFLRFNFVHEAPKAKPGPYDYGPDPRLHYVYAAFWNPTRTKGEFFQFIWFRPGSPTHLRIVNNAHIISSKGKFDLDDARWGVWTHEHLIRRLAVLESLPVKTVALRDVKGTGARCDSYIDAHLEWDPPPPAQK